MTQHGQRPRVSPHAAGQTTSQCPPLSGPTRRMRLASFSLRMFHLTPATESPVALASSANVTSGIDFMIDRIFWSVFLLVFSIVFLLVFLSVSAAAISYAWPLALSVRRILSSMKSMNGPHSPAAVEARIAW